MNPRENVVKVKPVVVVAPKLKHARTTPEESEAKTQSTSTDLDSSRMEHPRKAATPPVSKTTQGEEMTAAPAAETVNEGTTPATSQRAPRDPHGHKLIKIGEALDYCHKTKFLPIGDGQFTANVYFQPYDMKECGKTWCELEMLEYINGSTTVRGVRVYSMDAEDLLKMCYLHAMANFDLIGEPRLHYEQWVLTEFQKLCAECGSADYTERGSIARHYLDRIMYSFAVGDEKASSRLQMFFQKRCIRDLSGADSRATDPIPNANIVTAMSKSPKSKFEYQIEGFIFCVPEQADSDQPSETAKEGDDEMKEN